MFFEQRLGCAAKEVAQTERDQNGVVELADSRQEVGNYVDRTREVDDDQYEDELPPSPDPGVAQQSLEQDHAIGDETSESARLCLAAGEVERENRERVKSDADTQRN